MRFEALDPADVIVGRGRAAHESRLPYREALRGAEAGRIDLDKGETRDRSKRLLADAAQAEGKRIRSSYIEGEHAIVWKRVGA